MAKKIRAQTSTWYDPHLALSSRLLLLPTTQSFSLQVVEEKYQITDRRLGVGAFAEVRLALVKSTKDQLAVKILDKKKIRPLSQVNVTDLAREVTILKSMSHVSWGDTAWDC